MTAAQLIQYFKKGSQPHTYNVEFMVCNQALSKFGELKKPCLLVIFECGTEQPAPNVGDGDLFYRGSLLG